MKHHADGRGYPHHYPKTYLLSRGDVNQKQEPVEAGFLQVLASPSYTGAERTSDSNQRTTSFRRAGLADWMTDPEHGAGHLAARVIVNRLWHYHFGRGLVATPNDFGFQGDRPTHPELLDYLAEELIANDWKLKGIHKQLMMSAVFTQSSAHDAGDAAKDPNNQWWWRRTPQRLEAEPIRDSMLAVAGVLDKKMYGPGTLDPNMRRRSVYFTIKRSQLIPAMMLFDWPEHLVSIGSRSSTTIAPQALMFMNSQQGRQYAVEFAKRLPAEKDRAISTAYWLAFSREPTAKESQLSREFLARQANRYGDVEAAVATRLARQDFCQALLSSNEFVYVD